jgi:hypothetical protein
MTGWKQFQAPRPGKTIEMGLRTKAYFSLPSWSLNQFSDFAEKSLLKPKMGKALFCE